MSIAATLPRGCTFEPDDWAILARAWYPLARGIDVGDTPMAAVLLDVPLVVYRAGDQVVVADDLCPHRGLPLSMGSVTAARWRVPITACASARGAPASPSRPTRRPRSRPA